ncbi:hypothetical protein DKX38_025992 [Salix brachista]|uniref:Uncharacterized protein n=1 Tax=Salix brachista TaxID=2182728 RepID=A0A5N5JVM1_9ROSI|nr:hypothetical protein DKX38_025992 [Salix brachista]
MSLEVWVCKGFTELQPKLNLLKSGGSGKTGKTGKTVQNSTYRKGLQCKFGTDADLPRLDEGEGRKRSSRSVNFSCMRPCISFKDLEIIIATQFY